MQLIENKSLIIVEEPSNIFYNECKLIVTVPMTFRPTIGYGHITRWNKTESSISDESSISIEDSEVFYCPKVLRIFQYIGLEKKLLKLYRACDIDKNECSEFILEEFQKILDQEFRDVMGVWQLPNVNEQMWDNYKIFFPKQKPLPEQKLLKKASDLLNIKLRELSLNLKAFHESHRKQKSKKMSQDSSKDAVGS